MGLLQNKSYGKRKSNKNIFKKKNNVRGKPGNGIKRIGKALHKPTANTRPKANLIIPDSDSDIDDLLMNPKASNVNKEIKLKTRRDKKAKADQEENLVEDLVDQQAENALLLEADSEDEKMLLQESESSNKDDTEISVTSSELDQSEKDSLINDDEDDEESDADAGSSDDSMEDRQIAEKQKLLREKTRTNRKLNVEKLKRTIFVGNVPINTTKKEIRELFATCGDIESIRFRGIPADMEAMSALKAVKVDTEKCNDPEGSLNESGGRKTMRKMAAIKSKFLPHQTSMLTYVVFQDPASVEQALKMNGVQLKTRDLHIDRCKTPKIEHTLSVFVGNMPYKADEQNVRSCFAICGAINNIRLIRDRSTGMGKGFGFIEFCDCSAVKKALQMHEKVKLEGRQLRVTVCFKEQKAAGDAAAPPTKHRNQSKGKDKTDSSGTANHNNNNGKHFRRPTVVPTNLPRKNIAQFKKNATDQRIKQKQEKKLKRKLRREKVKGNK